MLLVPETLRTRGREGAVAEEHSTDGWSRDKGGCANPETRNLRGGRARPRPSRLSAADEVPRTTARHCQPCRTVSGRLFFYHLAVRSEKIPLTAEGLDILALGRCPGLIADERVERPAVVGHHRLPVTCHRAREIRVEPGSDHHVAFDGDEGPRGEAILRTAGNGGIRAIALGIGREHVHGLAVRTHDVLTELTRFCDAQGEVFLGECDRCRDGGRHDGEGKCSTCHRCLLDKGDRKSRGQPENLPPVALFLARDICPSARSHCTPSARTKTARANGVKRR